MQLASSNPLRAWMEPKGAWLPLGLTAWAGTSVFCPLHTPGSRTFRSNMASLALRSSDFTTGSPGPPAYRQHIMGLLSLHNHMSQYLIIDFFLCVYVCGCVYSQKELGKEKEKTIKTMKLRKWGKEHKMGRAQPGYGSLHYRPAASSVTA